MSATRTQIYLTPELRERIDRVARAQGTTMAEVIRTAVDRYLDETPDPSAVLAATFGADPTAEAPSRDEWTRG
jgi:predicted DNA-binding protein